MALNFQSVGPIAFESVSNVTATNSIDVGTIRIFNGEEYVYVYNEGNSQISVGYGAVPSSGCTGMSVTVSAATYFNACMGVVKHATLTTGTYGWLLTKGYTNIKMGADSSGIVGNPCYLGANGVGIGIGHANTSTTAFSQATSLFGLVPYAYLVQATASAGTAYGFVRCFGS